ncbi:MAG: response regulator [Oligoflexales bacterium]|nr:response regulator [Oligoflexales bacterium]
MRNRAFLSGIILLVLLTSPGISLGAPLFIHGIEDKAQNYGISNVIDFASATNNDPEVLSFSESINLGAKNTVFWFWFDINDTMYGINPIISVNNSFLNEIDFFKVTSTGEVERYSTGRKFPYLSRLVHFKDFLFPIHLEKNQSAKIFLRVKHSGPFQVPIKIYTLDDIMVRARNHYLYSGIYFGTILIIFIYALFLFVTQKQTVYLNYVVSLFLFCLFYLTLSGVGYEILWPDYPAWNLKSSIVLGGLYFASLAIFTKTFLGLKKISRLLDGLMTLLFFIGLGISIRAYIQYDLRIIKILDLYMSLIPFFLLLTGIWGVKRKVSAAYFYLSAVTVFFFCICIYALKDIGIIPTNKISSNFLLIGSFIEIVIFTFGLSYKVKKQIKDLEAEKISLLTQQIKAEKDLADERVRSSTSNAIANTTQMLAHDVRKPFSILKIGLDILRGVRSIPELKETLDTFAPEVEKAITSVGGMINDVMEIGRTTAPNQEPVSVESIIESCLSELCQVYQEAEITIDYDLAHTHMLNVDSLKVGRIFSNILGNAFQAIGYKGNILIKTSEEDSMMKICLGNKGSFIAQDDLPHLFDAFFTKDKKGGTGLGLAIAQKVVINHGGKIWCESSKEKNTVEFYFTLPVELNLKNTTTAKLAKTTKAIIASNKLSVDRFKATGDCVEATIDPKLYITNTIEFCRKSGKKLRVAVIDDEAVYRNAIKDMFEKHEDLNDLIEADFFETSEPLLKAFSVNPYDFLICDIDLGPASINGYEILKIIRQNGYRTAICVHSNRSLPEDYSLSIQLGAQAFLTKPMTYLHFLKFLSCGLESMQSTEMKEKRQNNSNSHEKEKIILVDDEAFYRKTLSKGLNDADVTLFENPESLLSRLENDMNYLSEINGIILDNYYDDSKITGLDIGEFIKKTQRFNNPIILMSNGIFSKEDIQGKVDGILDKTPRRWLEIKSLFPAEI